MPTSTQIGRWERRNQHGWAVVNQMHQLAPGHFVVLRSVRTLVCPDPEPDRWEYTVEHGVVRWVSNRQPLMQDVIRDLDIDKTPGYDPALHASAYDRGLRNFYEEYTRAQPPVPSPEEQYEIRAAFGPDAVVVDVISGRRFRTR